MSAVLYIEGGGDNRRLGAEFRQGWKAFLTNAGLSGRMPRVVRGGTRQQTFNRFTTALCDSKGGYRPNPPGRQRRAGCSGTLSLAARAHARPLG